MAEAGEAPSPPKPSDVQEEEPRLRYSPLGEPGDQPIAPAGSPATRLGVSDKVLAVGHRDGRVQLLDHLGNEVRSYKEHTREVTDLCFDEGAEFLASGSADGTVVVYGLYSEEVQRHKMAAPVTTVALDPRYGGRKTREFVYGTAAGVLSLSSKGWLGNRDTVLFQGKGPLRCARMAGTLLAWASDSGLRVYDTATHTRLGKLERPASAAADPSAPCSLLWRGERELFVGWGRQVMVLRVVGSLLPSSAPPAAAQGGLPGSGGSSGGGAGRSLQIVASFDAGCCTLGAAPFGAELAVLTWGPVPAGGSSSGGSHGGSSAGGGASGGAEVGRLLTPGPTVSTEESAARASATPEAAPAAAGVAAESSGQSVAGPAAAGSPGEHPAAGSAASQPTPEAAGQSQPGEQAAAGSKAEEEQQALSLAFFSRAGHLLAADGLGSRCASAGRRWFQLALLYPGEADLKLAAAVPPVLSPAPGTQRPSAAGSLAGSAAGTPRRTPAGSLAGSGRSSPAKGAGRGEGKASAAGSSSRSSPDKLPPDGAAGQAAAEQQEADGGGSAGSPAGSKSAEEHGQAAAAGGQGQGQAGFRQYKWWRDGEEPMYLVSGPEGIQVGRPRDGNDRVAWLSERGRYAEALAVAEEDRSVQPATVEAVGEQYLQALLRDQQYQEAAQLCPRVLQDSALAWERYVYLFAQARQLAALAPLLPTRDPQLKPSTYDMVLASLLLHPAEHGVLLDAVRAWPQGIYDVPALQSAVLSRMGGAAGSWPVLQQVAAHLYTAQGRHEEALKLMLQLRSPSVFDYIARHALVERLAPYAAALVDLDEVKSVQLLVEHCDEVPPVAVVAALQDSAGRAAEGEHRRLWRRRLHAYLDGLFHKDSQLGADFAGLQVELYAEFEPARLLNFLMISPAYPLESALQVCEARGLTREMVFVLGRMGSAEKALRLIVEGLRDVGQAVEFVQLQRDDDLWEQLIALTLGDAQLTGALLDHAGGYIDPLRVVSQIPQHLKVDNLRGRLVKIITDFRTQMSLQQGCNTILRHDCVVLANRLYRLLRSALRRLHLRQHQAAGGARWVLYDSLSGTEAAEDDAPAALLEGPEAAGGGGGGGGEAAAGGKASPAGTQAQQQQQQGAAGGAPQTQAGHAQPQQAEQPQRRVWVGFVGGPPPAAGGQRDGDKHSQAQHPARSPSKFVRLAGGGSAGASPAKSPGPPPPRKLLVS